MVRAATVIAALLAVAPAAASDIVRARVSQRDVEAIRATMRTATREPLLFVDPIYVPQPVPGSIPVPRLSGRPDARGKVRFRRITLYERTDQVSVMTGTLSAGSGGSYVLQKVGARWKILSRGIWME
jgi:hypothetical protein